MLSGKAVLANFTYHDKLLSESFPSNEGQHLTLPSPLHKIKSHDIAPLRWTTIKESNRSQIV